MNVEAPYWYDTDAAERAIEFSARFLTHVKGPLAGDPLILDEWQKDEIFRPIFGMKRPHSCASLSLHDDRTCEYGLRRYREAEIIIPRKAGKSTMDAIIVLIGLCGDDELGGENYGAAWDQEEAGLVFDIAATMVEHSKTLRRRLKIRRTKLRIVDPVTDSFYAAIPSDAAGAQGFNAHFVVFDEYQTIVTTDLDRALDTSQGARRQPLFIRSSTLGKTINSPMGRLYIRMKEVLAGTRPAREDELLVLHEMPEGMDPLSVEAWIAANPGYGTSLQPSYVERMIRKAKDEPSEQNDIFRYHLNIWTDSNDTWMPLDLWDATAGMVKASELKGRRCFVGVGMTSAVDLAAIALLFPPEEDDEPYRLIVEHYLPEETMRARAKLPDAPPYLDWVAKGALTVFDDSDVIDYAAIENAVLKRFGHLYDIQEIVANPRGAMQFIQDLQAEDQKVVEMRSSYVTMSPALTELMRLVRTKAFVHGGNVVLRYQMSRLVVKKGPDGEIRPDRERSRTSIEGVVALASALNRAITASGAEDERWTAS